MKTVILYESFFGNTKAVAEAIANAFHENVTVRNIAEIKWDELTDVNILIVGSATRGFRPCKKTQYFLKTIPKSGLKGVKVAAFDTRIALENIKSGTLRFIVNTGGYAAKHIARSMQNKGGELVLSPEGFLVEGEQGPLVTGELKRATEWGRQIVNQQLI